MYDVFVLYDTPEDTAAFDLHYADVHVPLVRAMPLLEEFTWGTVDGAETGGTYLVARMTYRSAADAERALATPEGVAAVADLDNFAAAGVRVLNVPRAEAG